MAILIGLILGMVLGLTGAGGAIFAVPLLILLLDLPAVEAMGLALSAVAVSALFGAYLQRKNILWLPVGVIMVAGVIAAPFGKWLSFMINEKWLVASFSILTSYIAINMLLTNKKQNTTNSCLGAAEAHKSNVIMCEPDEQGVLVIKGQCLLCLLFGGFLVGLASGLFGVGGGFMIVPLLVALTGVSMARAIASSLVIIALISFTGFISYLNILFNNGQTINYLLICELIIAALVAMILSQKIRNKLSEVKLRLVFSLLLLVMTVFMLNKQFLVF